MQQLRDMGQLPIEGPACDPGAQGATGEPGEPGEPGKMAETTKAQAKTLWDSGHVYNRRDRRAAMKAHMNREERLQVFGMPSATKAAR